MYVSRDFPHSGYRKYTKIHYFYMYVSRDFPTPGTVNTLKYTTSTCMWAKTSPLRVP